ncbi:nicotinate-nucleotide--dimethylbenzimidazole phosphoribosyltransferase [Amaricoccus solimangrovi]|uniref:Nicotinate-nucleotide--dimethylbenzimidazole phosphoribosyltransferase n=1 Tax=Amaricoccus solimangrovi TaxID=2589815 RepID=A0A501WCR3_9RHOB|nr:nicotinate-nucleotide--dimethylbenzimidazole phosphoribosyltransferase [Amaricoccus solimangrovi]TPE46612.1 nicotinate-nucleotide--dimethylbenzimidazole phosphoribosyltransferase [Amaricoccus solimangrovi]
MLPEEPPAGAVIADLESEVWRAIDGKTKPIGSLGRVEEIAAQIGMTLGTLAPRVETCALTIFAADHGIAAEGVSAFPRAVTRQMVANFLAGGAAATVIAASLGVAVEVVDAGVAGEPMTDPKLVSRRIGAGTRSFLREAAMTAEECAAALASGRELAARARADALAFGEMGIGNTSAATMLAHRLTGLSLEALVGRGTGLDAAGLARKAAVLAEADARVGALATPEEALREFGGFEIAMMAGAMLGAAEAGKLVLVDGFIATSAALVAERIAPEARRAMIFSHVSAEAGHRALLERMAARPILSLDMRLGEGTGALLAWPIVKAAAAVLRDMASFESAGVSARL